MFLIARDNIDEFVAKANSAVARMFGTNPDNKDYTSIVSDKHYARLESLVQDAAARGAKIVQAASQTIRPGNRNANSRPPSSAARPRT